MYFVRFFKIRCHFGQQFVRRNSYIDGKSKFISDPVFDLMSCFYRIRIDQRSAGHVKKNFIDRKGFHHRCIRCADFFKCHGAFNIKFKVTFNNNKIRTFSNGHCHRFTGRNSILFCRNGLCYNDPRTLLRITTNACRDIP